MSGYNVVEGTSVTASNDAASSSYEWVPGHPPPSSQSRNKFFNNDSIDDGFTHERERYIKEVSQVSGVPVDSIMTIACQNHINQSDNMGSVTLNLRRGLPPTYILLRN